MKYHSATTTPAATPTKELVEVIVGRRIWTEAQVEAYKAETLRKINGARPSWAWIWNTIIVMPMIVFCLGVGVLVLAAAAVEVVVRRLTMQLEVRRRRRFVSFELFSLTCDGCQLLYDRIGYPLLSWGTAVVVDGEYKADFHKKERIPVEAKDALRQIRTFFPNVRADVHFLGADPVLACHITSNQRTYILYPLVWDRVDGQDIIIRPPS